MLSVLVVDDDFRVSSVHRAYVERVEGFEVVGEVHSGTAALAAVEAIHPDLILLDIYLPDLSGLEVLRRIREAGRPQTDVVVITAAQDTASVHSSLQGGSLNYLVKPFTFARLRDVLEAYRSIHTRLTEVDEISQSEIDEMYAAVRGHPQRDLPKGHSPKTLALVVETLRAASEDLSCEEVALRAGLSRATAQRYLSQLAGAGRIELSLRYGRGRPEHRFRLL